ncbi:hypothetical protein GCM10011513_36920 [Franconibacter daqui]|uniref:hypothetical protein n=1 Tax=Franconibacter daqui TaxID=2047724 RepID=UPI001666EDE7|nr:hypothetical protein [Franconibacter daqui]GGD35747.1 hypothetical protein GCM10011513_36920 [Franconibacter daqui]
MRKGYQINTHYKGTRKRRYYAEEGDEAKRYNTQDGAVTFAYKGLVIDKRNSFYKVRDIKLEGFPVASVAGVFNDSAYLCSVIESGLSLASPSKLERLRKRNRNVRCKGCGSAFLFRKDNLIDYLEGKIIQCPCCYHEEWQDRLEWATDENFY